MIDVQDRICWRAAAVIIPLAVLYLLETLISKWIMLRDAGSLSGPVDIIRSARTDMLWLAAVCIFLISLASLFRGRYARFLSVSFASFILLALFALVFHCGLFLVTGIGINRDYISNLSRNPGEVTRMVLAEMKPTHIVLLLGQVALVLAILLLPGSGPVVRLKKKVRPGLIKAARVFTLFFLLGLEAAVFLPALDNVNESICRVPVAELAAAVLPAGKRTVPERRPPSMDISPGERMDSALELTPVPGASRPNIVIIIFESLSWKYSGVYDPKMDTTPFLDELAAKGLLVERMYTIVPHTSKALVSILGGIYPFLEPRVMEATPGILPERGLAHILKKQGYRTGFFQTANNYEERPAVVANLGFDTFKGLLDMPQEGFADVNYFGKEEMMMLKPSLKWVDEVRNGPFFLTYLTLSTHHHYGTPPGFSEKDYRTGNPALDRYMNAIRYTDGFIKKIFGEFRRRGLLDDTVFIILGDHGEGFNEHGLDGHNYVLWEEGLRMPALIYCPKIFTEPGRIKGYRSVLDIVPTACELAGLEFRDDAFIGKSLLRPVEQDRPMFFSAWSCQRAFGMRKGDLKYMAWPLGRRREAYNNAKDPDDREDFSGPGVTPSEEEAFQTARRWTEVVNAQYREWMEKSEGNSGHKNRKKFAHEKSAVFGSYLSLYGYDESPEQSYVGRSSIWVRTGLRCERKIKKPLELVALFKHEQPGLKEEKIVLKPSVPLNRMISGEYITADSFFVPPVNWPAGRISVRFGVLDQKEGEYLGPAGEGVNGMPEGKLVDIGTLVLHWQTPAQALDMAAAKP